MNTGILKKVEANNSTTDRPEIAIGDTVIVHTIIRDGEKTRIQKFEGLVISIKGAGFNKTFTVRKISYGVGVEKIFPLHSTNIEQIEVTKHANVRKSKLYYLKQRIGKAAMKLKSGKDVVVPTKTEEKVEAKETKSEAKEK